MVDDTGVDDDDARFTVEVFVEGVAWARGQGRSKQRAQQAAAAEAYAVREEQIAQDNDGDVEEPTDG